VSNSRTEIALLLEQHNKNEREGGARTFEGWIGVNCEIHPNDEIFKFIHDHPDSLNPLRDYLVDGWRTSYELMVLLEKTGQSLASCNSFLEFASGYGRLSRHLGKFPGATKVTVSDLMPGAIEFVRDTFGIDGFPSHHDPGQVEFPRQFEIVFVLSLFSHLPRSNWDDWLATLYSAVAPGGVLVFTTHGDKFAKRNGVTLDDDGFFFKTSSESDHLDEAEYGTTITSEVFVRNAIAKLNEAEVALFQQDHFWVGQDAWLLKKPL
jgi:SAM-dependent methyltransferase